MSLDKHYLPDIVEPILRTAWKKSGIYQFKLADKEPVFSIDTPPPTVSGHLHLGHVYSYCHPDIFARFWRMRGHNVFYPMGFDDNGLPTERLVEKRLGITPAQIGRAAFIQKCLQVSEEAEKDYRELWERLGLSIDWRYSYRTIDKESRQLAQYSFIDLFNKDLIYRQQAPAIWCPECQTSIAQAELNDLERESEFITIAFYLENGTTLPIATTRPELLPACVAVFVHPQDERYRSIVGQNICVPLFDRWVPVLEDLSTDPQKGSGAVMCCTFGDTTDIQWWFTYQLPLIEAIDSQGRMTTVAGNYAGLPIGEARRQITAELKAKNLVLNQEPIQQSVRVHERCDSPVEYRLAYQWFIRLMDNKDLFIKAGKQVSWHPENMRSRYQSWVENLNWDWCISRQRYFGVPFPVWYCSSCGEVRLAEIGDLPVDPGEISPLKPCKCGCNIFIPEQDVMDTWVTSSLSPQIAGRWLEARECPDNSLYEKVFPFALRPQAHEIIRTWAFYTLVKSHYHFKALPWVNVLISGWGIAGEGMGKISKSRDSGLISPIEMIQRYSADALRYWAASTGPGKDAVINEEKIQTGTKFITKLWNVARFSERFICQEFVLLMDIPPLTQADRWMLASLQTLVMKTTNLLENYDYAAAKSEIENFFWQDLADNYLEMCKQRLYDPTHPLFPGARYTLYQALLSTLKLLAPFLPYVTEAIYQDLFSSRVTSDKSLSESIHTSSWPEGNPLWHDPSALESGETLKKIATIIRRYKSEQNLPLGSGLKQLQLVAANTELALLLNEAQPDLCSVGRISQVRITGEIETHLILLYQDSELIIAIEP